MATSSDFNATQNMRLSAAEMEVLIRRAGSANGSSDPTTKAGFLRTTKKQSAKSKRLPKVKERGSRFQRLQSSRGLGIQSIKGARSKLKEVI